MEENIDMQVNHFYKHMHISDILKLTISIICVHTNFSNINSENKWNKSILNVKKDLIKLLNVHRRSKRCLQETSRPSSGSKMNKNLYSYVNVRRNESSFFSLHGRQCKNGVMILYINTSLNVQNLQANCLLLLIQEYERNIQTGNNILHDKENRKFTNYLPIEMYAKCIF